MAMSIEYDESGTFYYFILSFFAFILIPTTYYLFLNDPKKEDKSEKTHSCYCPPCELLEKKGRRNKQIKYLSRVIIILLWALFIGCVVTVSKFEKAHNEYNPYDVLGIDHGASDREIKKTGRKLSKIHHPDRGGNEKKFIEISKAIKALTDPLAKENWDKYGNPDGPSVAIYGVALPAWIVDKKNSHWVLASYMLAVIVIFPIVSALWWSRLAQYSTDEVLKDTQQLYLYFFHFTPDMPLKRAIMILGSSSEFEDIMDRASDNIELPALICDLPHLDEKNKEKLLSTSCSIKARTLLHAHFMRIGLPPNTLQKDLLTILKKCPYLIEEMINVVGQLIALGKAGRISITPQLESLENLIKLSQMITQAVWESDSAFLMLPHITQDHLCHFNTKNIESICQFIEMDNKERRLLLHALSDEQYQDVINVCLTFPRLMVDVKVKVIDDEDMYLVTSGSIVTVVVNLTRGSFGEYFEDKVNGESGYGNSNTNEGENEEEETNVTDPQKLVERKAKKRNGMNKPAKEWIPLEKKITQEEKKQPKEASDHKMLKQIKDKPGKEESNAEINNVEVHTDKRDPDNNAESECPGIKDDDLIQPKKLLEVKSKESCIVHAPYLPLEKHEYWWVYIVLNETNDLRTPLKQITCLKEQEEIKLQFTAPEKPGAYQYSVIVRSDSYVDFDTTRLFKLNVTDPETFDAGTHWDFSSDEGKEDSGESVYETEEEEDLGSDDE